MAIEIIFSQDLLGPDPEQLCQTVSAAQSIEELRSSQGYHSAMSSWAMILRIFPMEHPRFGESIKGIGFTFLGGPGTQIRVI